MTPPDDAGADARPDEPSATPPRAGIPSEGPEDPLDPSPRPSLLRCLARRLGLDERGTVNFMTGIVVVAGLLASGAAAAIFLQGADHLKQTGEEVSEEATGSTLSSLKLVEVYGEAELGRLTVLHEVVTPGTGSPPLELDTIVVSLHSGDMKVHYTFAKEPTAGNFSVRIIRDADGSVTGPVPIANRGDLIEIVLPLPDDKPLLPRAKLEQSIVLEGGNRLGHTFEVPAALRAGEFVQFRL